MPRSTTHRGVRAADAIFARRAAPGRALAQDAGRVAAACHAMAARLHRGGKLLVFGMGPAATDAQHIAVEFVHPVIVGKRALLWELVHVFFEQPGVLGPGVVR